MVIRYHNASRAVMVSDTASGRLPAQASASTAIAKLEGSGTVVTLAASAAYGPVLKRPVARMFRMSVELTRPSPCVAYSTTNSTSNSRPPAAAG